MTFQLFIRFEWYYNETDNDLEVNFSIRFQTEKNHISLISD